MNRAMVLGFADYPLQDVGEVDCRAFEDYLSVEDRVHLIQLIERHEPTLEWLARELLDSTVCIHWEWWELFARIMSRGLKARMGRARYRLDGIWRHQRIRMSVDIHRRKPDAHRRANRKWALANPEKVREYQRRYAEKRKGLTV